MELHVELVVGSSIGSLKHVRVDSRRPRRDFVKRLKGVDDLGRDCGVARCGWAREDALAIARRDRSVQTYDFARARFDSAPTPEFDGAIVGVGGLRGRLVAGLDSGSVHVWGADSRRSWRCEGPLERARPHESSGVVATGGDENDLKLWDAERGEAVFRAKNVPHDWLRLRVPVRVSDACFPPEGDGRLVAVCSRLGYVRLYDARAQRRPVVDVTVEDKAFGCLTPGFRERHALVGAADGTIRLIDMRKLGKVDKSYKGAVGAVTDVVCDAERGFVASTSLDRHLRIHDAETKRILHKQYLTTKLTCLALRSVSKSESDDECEEVDPEVCEDSKQEKVESDNEYEELFDNMEVIKDERKAKNADKTTEPKLNKRKLPLPVEEAEISSKTVKTEDEEDALLRARIRKLLKNTEKQKLKYSKDKKRKKSKSIFFN